MSNRILIYGYGREGQSTEAWLHQHHYPEVVDIYDAKTHPIKFQWEDYDQIWLSPGVDPQKIPTAHQLKITNQADYFFSNLSETQRQKVIAITGSKGKTTTTQVLAHFLESLGHKTQAAGNIGIPLLEAFTALDDLDYLVVEISSFQAEFIRRSPHTVVFLNLFADHLDRHGNKANYLAAKEQLWAHQKSGDHFITPALNKKLIPNTKYLIPPSFAKPLSRSNYPLDSILNADHFRENLGVLPVVAENLGLKYTKTQLKKALQSSPLPAHRLELVGEYQGLKFYDDAIAVNPTATMAAVKHFGTSLGVLILGGKSSGDDPTELIRLIESIVPQTKIIITKSELSREVKPIKTTLHITEVKNLTAAVALAMSYQLPSTKIVLLSPAAKSYDQYENFEAKGNEFKELLTTKISAKIGVKK